jgi:hypothetical protein
MEKEIMKRKTLSITLATLAIVLCIMVGSAQACTTTPATTTWPKLPSAKVQMSVADGQDSYFVTTLYNVPSGYDVTNKAYNGWCIDRNHLMTRDTKLCVTLYSSLNPPSSLSSIPWNKINYVLNHQQGSIEDVEIALWYFAGWWSYSNLADYPNAKSMVDAANSNPNFIPSYDDVVAVVLVPCDASQQLSIIEVGHQTCNNYHYTCHWKYGSDCLNRWFDNQCCSWSFTCQRWFSSYFSNWGSCWR